MKSGIEEGRKDATSIDGSKVFSTQEEIFELVSISVIGVQPSGGGTEVVLGFENTSETAVHLIGLMATGEP